MSRLIDCTQQPQCPDETRWLTKAILWFSLACTLLAAASLSLAQETRATLGGRVLDPQGMVVAGATVTVTAEATGVQQTLTTNESGNWRAQALVPGPYHVEVSAQGFKKTTQSGIQLQIGDQKFIDIALTVGAATDSVTVEAVAPLIDTTAAVSGTVITTSHLAELPSQSNVATLLVGLTPGAVVGAATGGSVHLWSNISASSVTINGAGVGTRSINYTIDGASNSKDDGQVCFVPPMEALSEFKVITNAYDASIVNQSAATINMSLKSGTSAFHGSAYENNQNNTLNANRWENDYNNSNPANKLVPVAPMHVNEWGATFGGPLLLPKLYDGRKKQTFFFFSYDGIRNKTPGSTGYMGIPTMAERAGDFSQSFVTVNGAKTPVTIYDPLAINSSGVRSLFPGNVIPSGRISPIATNFFKLMPAPDGPGDTCSDCNNYLKRITQNDKFVGFAGKVDQTWGNSQHSYASFRYNDWSEISYDDFGIQNSPLVGLWQYRTNRGMTLDHTWAVSKNLFADFRYNLTAWDGGGTSATAGMDPTALGFKSAYVGMMSLASIPQMQGIVSGADENGPGTNQISHTNVRIHELSANLTHTLNNHTFRYGVLFSLQQRANGNLWQAGGQYNFTGAWTQQSNTGTQPNGAGSAVASFDLGLPNSGKLGQYATGMWSQHNTGFYFQDDWRVTNKLTVNAGLRWDYQRPTTDRGNQFYTFDPTIALTPVANAARSSYTTLLTTAAGTNAGLQLLQAWGAPSGAFNVYGGRLYAGVNGNTIYTETPRHQYLQPRLGFAYRVRENTVVRGGLGRFVQASFNTGGQDGYSVETPFTATNDNYLTSYMSFANMFPNGTLKPTGNTNGILTNPGQDGTSSTSPFNSMNIGRPYVDEASLHVQHQIKDYLIEVGGTLDITHNAPLVNSSNSTVGYNINLPGTAAWMAAYGPTFDATGRPINTYPGDVQINNPFKGNPYITSSLATANQVSAYQLIRPNPLYGDWYESLPMGKYTYYALQSKVERRFKKGFSVMNSFTWSKKFNEASILNQVVSNNLVRQIDSSDRRFLDSLTSTYVLPFGRGKLLGKNVNRLVDGLIGGWEVSGVYGFASGTPVTLPTNTAFWSGANPSLGSDKTRNMWFDASQFMAFPTKTTCLPGNPYCKSIVNYPTWTNIQTLPGFNYYGTPADYDANGKCVGVCNGVYQDFKAWTTLNPTVFGNIRVPFTNNVDLGLRKTIPVNERVKVQLRFDAFNALNHPTLTGPGSDANALSGGTLGILSNSVKHVQANAPRMVQLGAKITF